MSERARHDVDPLVELALHTLLAELGIEVDDAPPAVKGILRRFGLACHQKGAVSEREGPPTGRTKTLSAWPAVEPDDE